MDILIEDEIVSKLRKIDSIVTRMYENGQRFTFERLCSVLDTSKEIYDIIKKK